MPEDIRLWAILDADSLREIKAERLDLEKRIEGWIANDISILASDLLIIGQQVETNFGGFIDLLCLDRKGDTVIVELKRDKTPREITAQVLDYASWVNDLSNDRITEIANGYLGSKGPLDHAFKARFGDELPEVLNEQHKMIIVGSQIDASSERIMNYLSDNYGVSMNAATFHYLRDTDGREFLARLFLIEPERLEHKAQASGTSKRKPTLSYDELISLAETSGVGDLYKRLLSELTKRFDRVGTTRSSTTFIGDMGGSFLTILSLIPGESTPTDGVRFQIYSQRLARYLSVDVDRIASLLPKSRTPWTFSKWDPEWSGFAGFFKEPDEIQRFLDAMDQRKSATVAGAPSQTSQDPGQKH